MKLNISAGLPFITLLENLIAPHLACCSPAFHLPYLICLFKVIGYIVAGVFFPFSSQTLDPGDFGSVELLFL